MVGLVTVIYYGNTKLGWALLLIWLYRIYRLKIKHFLWINLFFLGLVSLICTANQYKIHHQLIPTRLNQSVVLKVHPDDLKFNGNTYTGKAYLNRHSQWVLIYGFVKNQVELNHLKKINRTSNWQVNADVTGLSEPTNVNQFNSKRYFHSQNITNSVKINRVNSIQAIHNFNLIDSIHNFRQNLINRARHLPHYLSTYTLSLILGLTDKSMDDELTGIKQLGLIHLFSISGFHVYYLISVLELIFISLHFRREYYKLIIIMGLPLYFIFAGASIGLLRSILMVEIGMISRYLKRPEYSIDVWSGAFLINLILEPQMLVQFGCQLSYALSLGLIFTSKYGFLKRTFLMNLISFPFIIYNIYTWHILTLFANLIILPLFSPVVFPIVIIGSLASGWSLTISQLASLFIEYFDKIVNLLGRLPGNLTFGQPNAWLLSIAGLVTLLLVVRSLKRYYVLLIILYSLMFCWIHFPINGEVTYFDVGQGDSFLVRQPFNKSVTMIDTGGRLSFGKKISSYQAERISINYLKSRGIDYLDNLCISHQDSDHCGDLPAVLNDLKVKRLIIPLGMEYNNNFMKKVIPNLGKTKLIPVKNDDVVDGLPFHILHPFVAGKGSNGDSMVLSGIFGAKRWLFTGDLDQTNELKVITRYPGLTADVLKLGHHGSRTASAPQFLDAVHPQIAIISAGRNNRYHHPNKEVVDRVNQRHIKIYNTQKSGMISYIFRKRCGTWHTRL